MSKKNYNTGIDIVKIWMCFEVVICHFMNFGDNTADSLNIFYRILFEYRLLAAPIFMILAFYLSDIQMMAGVRSKFIRRLKRLEGANVFWAVVYFAILIIWDDVWGTKNINGGMDFVWQILFGHCFNRTLWFQIDLIIITVGIYLVYRILGKDYSRFVLGICLIVCIMIQYTGMHTLLYGLDYPKVIFRQIFDGEYVYITIGRLFEMLPYAVIGVFLKDLKGCLEEKDKLWEIFMIIALLVFIFKFQVFTETVGFSYQGLDKVSKATLTTLIFLLFEFKRIPETIKKVLRWLSMQTMSVYFMHRLIGYMMYESGLADNIGMKRGTLGDCLVIFVLCVLLSDIMRRIPSRLLQEYVL